VGAVRSKLLGGGVTLLLLVGCNLLAQVQRLGITTGDQGVEVRYVLCPGELLTRVAALAGDDETGAIIWEATGTVEGPGVVSFALGAPPEGLSDSVPLQASPPPGSELTVEVGASAGGGTSTSSVSFDPGTLRPGEIFTLGGNKDPATFEEDARETCGS
jgi:hypothetical protein